MTAWDWVIALFIGYWVVTWIWIKGTDPLSSSFFHVLWIIIKIPLFLCGGFVIFALLCGSSSRS